MSSVGLCEPARKNKRDPDIIYLLQMCARITIETIWMVLCLIYEWVLNTECVWGFSEFRLIVVFCRTSAKLREKMVHPDKI